ncbi:MAG: hypothetical protein BV459_03285 [Thermoplasmata archaeon M11B2D]|nr:MAG: hypothetical protein BV459_03285 [Thermoplasmata archaeon M11B2D]
MSQASIAYWIDPKGKLVSGGLKRHIELVAASPTKFLISKKEVESIYNKHNEVVGTEGKAREEIIKKILSVGFIRLRIYPNDYWSVTVDTFNRRAKVALQKWAQQEGGLMPVKISQSGKPSAKTIEYTVDELANGDHLFEQADYELAKTFTIEVVDIEHFGFDVDDNAVIFNRNLVIETLKKCGRLV